mmetsp:Transcript_26584/g.45800  ORF Transcript_26584/g.45800 Transcript_26584/m.45800 type:complete len:342 (+) Transcript_26584:371-1396(+)
MLLQGARWRTPEQTRDNAPTVSDNRHGVPVGLEQPNEGTTNAKRQHGGKARWSQSRSQTQSRSQQAVSVRHGARRGIGVRVGPSGTECRPGSEPRSLTTWRHRWRSTGDAQQRNTSAGARPRGRGRSPTASSGRRLRCGRCLVPANPVVRRSNGQVVPSSAVTGVAERLLVLVLIVFHCAGALLLLFGDTGHDVVDAEQEARRLDGRFDGLGLDNEGLPHAFLLHVADDALVAVDAPRDVGAAGVLRPEFREDSDDIGATVLGQGPRDNLQRDSNGAVGVLLHTLDRLGFLQQGLRKAHFDGAATWNKSGIEKDVASDSHGVDQVALNFVKDVLTGATEKD